MKIYEHKEEQHNTVAPNVVLPIIFKMNKPHSILDVGCGIGTWLKVCDELGIRDYCGIDGDHVDASMIQIPREQFITHDLNHPFDLGREFDLVISLEVAEHLPVESADLFVQSLVRHGKSILFSAAVPGQVGQNHLNEQWPDYWQQKFRKHGYYFHDVIRMQVWNDTRVNWWYRQNMFVVTPEENSNEIVSLIHPGCFESKSRLLEDKIERYLSGKIGIRKSANVLARAVFNSIVGRISSR